MDKELSLTLGQLIFKARREAETAEEKRYIRLTLANTFEITDFEPERGRMAVEIYPGGRTVDWRSTLAQ